MTTAIGSTTLKILFINVFFYALPLVAQSNTDITTFTTEVVGINCTQPDHQLDSKTLNDFIKSKGQFRFEITQLSSEPFMDSRKAGGVVHGYFLTKVYDRNSESNTPLFTLEGAGTRAGSLVQIEGKNSLGNSLELAVWTNNPLGADGSINGSSLSFDCDPFYTIDEIPSGPEVFDTDVMDAES